MHTPPRILIVDDNEMNRDILVTRLSTQGYELFQAADGEEALTAAMQHLPDLILLDVMMPKLDGMEVCRRLKADANLPFMPIILVTAKAASTDVVAGLEAGADEYLTKPIDQMALVARVKSVLRIKDCTIKCGRKPPTLPRGIARSSSASRSNCPRSSAWAGYKGSSRRRSPISFSPQAMIAC
jgi:DNA-binding response OmpR family regulator